MGVATREDIVAALGSADEMAVAEIIEMGTTPEEVAEMNAWLSNDEALINIGRPLPTGRVGRLIEIAAELDARKEDVE
jgi:hypothetical protein